MDTPVKYGYSPIKKPAVNPVYTKLPGKMSETSHETPNYAVLQEKIENFLSINRKNRENRGKREMQLELWRRVEK